MVLKKVIQAYVTNGIALFLTSVILPGFILDRTYQVMIVGTAVLTLAEIIIKPVIKLISIPINMITLGFFNFIINIGVLYAVVYIVDGLEIENGTFDFTFLNQPNIGVYELQWYWILIIAAFLLSFFNYIFKKILF